MFTLLLQSVDSYYICLCVVVMVVDNRLKSSIATEASAGTFSEVSIHTHVIAHDLNVYCPECPPGGTIGHPGGQQKKFLPFGHGRDRVAFNGTGL